MMKREQVPEELLMTPRHKPLKNNVAWTVVSSRTQFKDKEHEQIVLVLH